MWIPLCADDPGEGSQTHVERVEGIGNLGVRDVHHGAGIAVESLPANVAHDPDDLARSFRCQFRHQSLPDPDLIAKRVGLGPELPRHRLIDDDYRVRAGVVALVESTATQHRYSEGFEIAGRYRYPPASAMKRALLQRPAHNQE